VNIETFRDVGDLGVLYLGRFGDDPRKRVEFVDTIEPGVAREDKWVLMVSTQFGCPVRCLLCDAGSLGFYGNLDENQILEQIEHVFRSRPAMDPASHPKLKIHFARMGEPSLNPAVPRAMETLARGRDFKGLIPSFSTVAPRGDKPRAVLEDLRRVKEAHYPNGRFQLQFSLHGASDAERDRVVPVPKWSLAEIAEYGERFVRPGDRKITLNFALVPGARLDAAAITDRFDPSRFLVKVTPVNPTERSASTGTSNPWFDTPEALLDDADRLRRAGFRVIPSPSAPAEIEAATSCGQLWSSVMRRRARSGRPPSDGGAERGMVEAARFERRAFDLEPRRAGLLVVDMQNHFLDSESSSYLRAGAHILPRVLRLVRAFRDAGSEPLFTRHSYRDLEREGGRMLEWWRAVCREGDPGSRLPEAFEAESNRNFRKTRYSAFTNPRLLPALRRDGVEDLVLAGVSTNLCVESTARAAFDLGFRVFVAADATAARCEELHLGALKSLAHGFARVVSVDELERALGPVSPSFPER
jgi:23S rRNA (adenine2503-C2)-methyltransferase